MPPSEASFRISISLRPKASASIKFLTNSISRVLKNGNDNEPSATNGDPALIEEIKRLSRARYGRSTEEVNQLLAKTYDLSLESLGSIAKPSEQPVGSAPVPSSTMVQVIRTNQGGVLKVAQSLHEEVTGDDGDSALVEDGCAVAGSPDPLISNLWGLRSVAEPLASTAVTRLAQFGANRVYQPKQ